MTEVSVVVHANADVLASAVAARLAVRMIDAQAERGVATVVLTGGRIAERTYAALAASTVRDAVDWGRVDLWWGDERFLPGGDPERNETQVRGALLESLPLSPDRVHPMPASDGPDGDDPEAAAARYTDALAASAGGGHQRLPHFDVVLLGIGEDGHVASVFPEHPVAYDTRPCSAVRGSPKPPPIRLTLTFAALNTADDVWIIASGDDKANAVGLALAGAGPVQVPAAGVHGTQRTMWLLDRAAAADVSPRLRSLR
ncbi:MAG TPA: 6-phosphogluconolactonase [Micromonosporaceae bacterium]|jgi:6-phosphogluconolactonase|nr:6-phosphogluconolactonase [Micromonosporaceae bacterium]